MNDNDGGARYVVRYLAFVVVQAVMRARGNAGRSDCVSTVSVQSVRVRLRFASARIRIFWKLVRKNVRRFIGRAVCVASVMSRGTD